MPVFFVRRRKRVASKILASPSVHVAVDGSSKDIEEGISNWISLAPTANNMLKNMRAPFIVLRQSSDYGCENIIFVAIFDVIYICVSLIMLVLMKSHFIVLRMHTMLESEASNALVL